MPDAGLSAPDVSLSAPDVSLSAPDVPSGDVDASLSAPDVPSGDVDASVSVPDIPSVDVKAPKKKLFGKFLKKKSSKASVEVRLPPLSAGVLTILLCFSGAPD